MLLQDQERLTKALMKTDRADRISLIETLADQLGWSLDRVLVTARGLEESGQVIVRQSTVEWLVKKD